MIEFQGKFDASVTKTLNKHSFKKLTIPMLIFSAVIIAIGVLGIIYPDDNGDMSNGIVIVCTGVGFLPAVALFASIVQKFINKSMHIMNEETVEIFRFTQDTMSIIQVKQRVGAERPEYEASMTANYSYLYGAEETKTHYFLRISLTQQHVVNKVNLTQGTIEELNQILYTHLGKKFKGRKSK